ncbi:MAG: chemotaxis protein CheW [Treponema sp.]|jgi:purine-binding chemotaxis protein CheW|nr:chemotaxis protein CheW [Treponema sp.]
MTIVKDLAQVNAELQEQKERADTVDFKMVTFSLAGKDYGVDIMNVKEIAKANKFTYVPNSASFVRGVYNLRGDIIPVVDLRMFFRMPGEKKKDNLENMLILRIEERVYGTIVDKIDKVIGIDSESIQPPHPIFGDINIKFISGVVEKQGNLYIILDVLRIFSQTEDDKKKPRGVAVDAGSAAGGYFTPPPSSDEDVAHAQRMAVADSALDFIKESLPALRKFYPSSINDEWVRRRFISWSESHSGDALQLKDTGEADEFLYDFMSPDSGNFWRESHAALVKSILPNSPSNVINVWNIGCGRGYETFSFACILKARYPDARIKIWANDSDIMAISQAPNLNFEYEDVSEFCRPYLARGRNGYSFNQEIKDSIVFEYHDILNDNPLPDLDIILIRDVLSFFQVSDQERLVKSFEEKLRPGGMVIVGKNEVMPGTAWQFAGKEPVSAFVQI